MKMTAEEVKEFWRDFCSRHGVTEDTAARGDAKIDADPEYWADHTMWQLLEALSGSKKK